MQVENQELESEKTPLENKETPQFYQGLSEVDSLVNEATDDETAVEEDLSRLSKDQLLERASEFLNHHDLSKATKVFKNLKDAFEELLKEERGEMMREHAAAGADIRDFKPPHDEKFSKFNSLFKQFNDRKVNERKRAEDEKMANLKAKEAILERMKQLIDTPETAGTREEMNELQVKWKQVRSVPQEFRQHLWDAYHFCLEKYHDNLSINNELKELDRRKNLEAKIELTKKVDALHQEPSIKRAMILLNKYHEDFKNLGPVPQEIREEVWTRFKATSDSVLNEKKGQIEELNEQREANLSLKQILCEKAEQLTLDSPSTPKDWNEKVEYLKMLFEEWKKVGQVPREQSDAVWERFKKAQSAFYEARREFFKKLNVDKEENLKQKIALCEQAEKAIESTDYIKTTEFLLSLQEKWKTIGPALEPKSQQVWKRFRAAFDEFFKRKEHAFKEKRQVETVNLKVKEEIIAGLKELATSDDSEQALGKLKELQMKWLQTGFVPGKDLKRIQTEYQQATDEILSKFKRNRDEVKASFQREHFQVLANSPDGSQRLKTEEKKLRDRIGFLKSDMQTLENNLLFFANSKNADSFKKQFEDKINASKAQIQKLEAELKVLKGLNPVHAK